MISKKTRSGHLHLKMWLDFRKQVLMSHLINYLQLKCAQVTFNQIYDGFVVHTFNYVKYTESSTNPLLMT